MIILVFQKENFGGGVGNRLMGWCNVLLSSNKRMKEGSGDGESVLRNI